MKIGKHITFPVFFQFLSNQTRLKAIAQVCVCVCFFLRKRKKETEFTRVRYCVVRFATVAVGSHDLRVLIVAAH
jgi:hypothetical protein